VDETNRNTALASALVEELARCGIEHACISPGSRSAPLALAFWKEERIHAWSHVDERCAGFFAIGLAQATGKPVAVLTTSGTAGANLHPAVAEASESGVPLIVLTADRPPELRGRGAGQTIDQLKLYGSAVRWFCELGIAAADDEGLLHFRSAAARAVSSATGMLPGPVHLNVPFREPLAPVPLVGDVTAEGTLARRGREDDQALTTVRRGRLSPTDDLVSSLEREIGASPRGVIMAGRQRDRALPAAIAALAQAASYPILAEPTSQARAGEHDLSHVVSSYDAILRAAQPELTPDLVIRFGDMVTSKATRQWLEANRDCTQIVIDPEGRWNEPTSTADHLVRVDPVELCRQLAPAIEPRGESEWLERWRAASLASEAAIDEFLGGLGGELFEPRVHRELARLLPSHSTVYVGSSMPVRDLETFFPAVAKPLFFLCNRGANGIDGLISSGLGAAAGAPGRTFVLTGDLGLYHDMNGLLAMKRHGVEATIVVMNNGGGAIFDFLPIAEQSDGYEELFATPTGLDLERVAHLYGIGFTRVGAHDELAGALSRAGLVDIPLDRARNLELHREVFARVTRARFAQA
jgi:2-succinyl-5-enolpyruvyl-6-hydroxy-3-cyclohexene-1-carboxylate synthase